MTAFPSDLNLAVALFFEFPLGLASWANDLTNVVGVSIIVLWYEDLLVALRGLVVAWRNVGLVHLEELGDQTLPLFHVLVLVALFSGVDSLAFAVVHRFRTRGSEVRVVVLLEVLHDQALGEILDAVFSDQDFDFILGLQVDRKMAVATQVEVLHILRWLAILIFDHS